MSFCIEIYFDANYIDDDIDAGPVCAIEIFATPATRWSFAGATHMQTIHHVAETFEGAVVFGPLVFDKWV